MDAQGLYDKYEVRRRDNMKKVEEFTFTLVPEHDEHAVNALVAYADSVEGDNPQLADDIDKKLEELGFAGRATTSLGKRLAEQARQRERDMRDALK